MLSFPEGDGENEPENDYGKIPHIEQLAFHLVDCARAEPEVRWSSFLIASFSGIDLVCNRWTNCESRSWCWSLPSQTRMLMPSLSSYDPKHLFLQSLSIWQILQILSGGSTNSSLSPLIPFHGNALCLFSFSSISHKALRFSACLTGYRIVALLYSLVVESQDLNFDLYRKLLWAPPKLHRKQWKLLEDVRYV